MKQLFRNAASDVPASVVVFLVALPLCLGVAVASDAAPVTGIIAGVVGGIIVGIFSGSQLSVSGPAAGLTAIVAGAIGKLPSYEVFLVGVVLAGAMQFIFGVLKAGLIGDFIPNSVIKGMLAAIGLILILKQLPHLVGYDSDPEGDQSFFQPDQENTFSGLFSALNHITPGAVLIGICSAIILLIYETKAIKKQKIFKLIPGPLIVVIVGILINQAFISSGSALAINSNHLVQLDVFDQPLDFFSSLPSPSWANIGNKQVWITAITIAIVASLESLLCLEAIDKIDPEKRLSPTNRELKAQGIGNMVSGLVGGLPVTSVIVRSSANVDSGAKSKMSTILHGILLLLTVLLIPGILNMIPKAALAAILIFTGYKLAKIPVFKAYWKRGMDQFLPFVITIAAILLTDLLIGICVGILVGLVFILRSNFKSAVFVIKDEFRYLIRFRKEVSFLNKSVVKNIFEQIPDKTAVMIDATKSDFIDKDIIDLVNDFIVHAELRGIRVYIKYSATSSRTYFNDVTKNKIK